MHVGEEATFAQLHRKILSAFEQRNPNVRGLKDLRVTELRKILPSSNQLQQQMQSSQMQETVTLPTQGKVGDHLHENDKCIFKIDSQ